MPFPIKQIVTALVLMSFIAIVLFSFVFMMHGASGRMFGGCPFLAMGPVICPPATVAVAINPTLTDRAFLNLPVGFGLVPPVIFSGHILNNFPLGNSFHRKIIRWLSLKAATF